MDDLEIPQPLNMEIIVLSDPTSDDTDNESELANPPTSNEETDELELQQENSQEQNTEQTPSKKRPRQEDTEEEDGMTCPICLDNWTNSGEHRICSLKCGHLFGYKCITRWLEADHKVCPTCRKRVHTYDIRYIYARKLLSVDTTELTQVKQQLALALEEKNKIKTDLLKASYKEASLLRDIENYKKSVKLLSEQVQNQYQQSNCASSKVTTKVRLYREKSIELGKMCGCRVINAKSSLDLITVSVKSPNALYSGFGIRKYTISSYKSTAFIGLHTQTIRDLKFHPENPWILTAALDKDSAIVDLNSNERIMSVTTPSPLWSCCWNTGNPQAFFLGTGTGTVLHYDTRKLEQPLDEMKITSDLSPVVSVQSIKSQSFLRYGGVLACKLQSLWCFENTNPNFTPHPLPIEGPFCSMTYNDSTGHMLISARPSEKHRQSRHIIATLNSRGKDMVCEVVHTFLGGRNQKMMSRSCLLSKGNDYVAAYVDDTQTADIWSINSGVKAGAVNPSDYVLDLVGCDTADTTALLALTQSKIELHKFV